MSDKKFKTLIVKDMRKRGDKNKLHGFEQAKNIELITTPFQDITDPEKIVTDTFKLKRHQARGYFKKEIDRMYKEGVLR